MLGRAKRRWWSGRKIVFYSMGIVWLDSTIELFAQNMAKFVSEFHQHFVPFAKNNVKKVNWFNVERRPDRNANVSGQLISWRMALQIIDAYINEWTNRKPYSDNVDISALIFTTIHLTLNHLTNSISIPTREIHFFIFYCENNITNGVP